MSKRHWISRRLVSIMMAFVIVLGGAAAMTVVAATPAHADSSSDITAAVDWAVNELGRTAWDVDGGECLLFVYDAYYDGAGISIGTADTAYDYWLAYPNAQITNGSTPPEGALVFWGPTPSGSITYDNPDGHVALSLGSGNVISSEERDYTGIHEFTIAARNADGYPYFGWMMPPGITAPSSDWSGLGNYTSFGSDEVVSGQKLPDGSYITSSNVLYALVLQDDGNLVLDYDGSVLWASGTNGESVSYLDVQDDGNLVAYNASGVAMWASNTAGQL